MNYIKTVQKIKNHKLIIDIPEDFKSEEVEVIVLPLNEDDETDKSMMQLSEDSFKEWDNDADSVYDKL